MSTNTKQVQLPTGQWLVLTLHPFHGTYQATDLVDSDGQTVSHTELFETASQLCGGSEWWVEEALTELTLWWKDHSRVIHDSTEAHASHAEQHDVDQDLENSTDARLDMPIDYWPVPAPDNDNAIDPTHEEPTPLEMFDSCFGDDPEAPLQYQWAGEEIDQLALEHEREELHRRAQARRNRTIARKRTTRRSVRRLAARTVSR